MRGQPCLIESARPLKGGMELIALCKLLVAGKRYIYAALPSSEMKRGAEDIE